MVEPGTVQAGAPLELLEPAPTTVTIQTVAQLMLSRAIEPAQLAEVLALPHLPESLKRQLASR